MKSTQSQLLQFSEGDRRTQIIRKNVQHLELAMQWKGNGVGNGSGPSYSSNQLHNSERYSEILCNIVPYHVNEVLPGLVQWSPNILDCIHPSIKFVISHLQYLFIMIYM